MKPINLEEIRILQDVIIFRAGMEKASKQEKHGSCCLRTGRGKKTWIRKALDSQAERRALLKLPGTSCPVTASRKDQGE